MTTAGGDKSTSFTVYFCLIVSFFFLRICFVTPFKQVVFKSFRTSCRYLTPIKSQRVVRTKADNVQAQTWKPTATPERDSR